ncbi:MAG: type II toxin-antitoxin system YafQ family toxin [Thermodesulfobacteriota bacterium]
MTKRKLVWSSNFKRAYKKAVKKNPQIKDEITAALYMMENDLYNYKLSTHKLSGNLKGYYAASCGYDCRIIFTIKKDQAEQEMIVLVTFGSHDAVY